MKTGMDGSTDIQNENPCNECLVVAMCKKECNKLTQYLYNKKCKTEDKARNIRSYEIVALGIRLGVIVLYDEDRKWRWNHAKSM